MKISLVPGGETYADLLTIDEIAEFANITDPDNDDKIRLIANGVFHHIERDLGRAFIFQDIELPIECNSIGWIFGYGRDHWNKIKLPYPPIVSLEDVKWQEWDGTEHVIDPSKYAIDTRCQPGILKFTGDGMVYPSTVKDPYKGSIVVKYRSGYAPGKFPEGLKLIAKRIIATHIENPENTIAGIDESVLLLPPELANTMELYRIYDFDVEYGS